MLPVGADADVGHGAGEESHESHRLFDRRVLWRDQTGRVLWARDLLLARGI